MKQHPANVEMQIAEGLALERIREQLGIIRAEVRRSGMGDAVFGIVTTVSLAVSLLALGVSIAHPWVSGLCILACVLTVGYVIRLLHRYTGDVRHYQEIVSELGNQMKDVKTAQANLAWKGHGLHPEFLNYWSSEETQGKSIVPFVEWGYRLRSVWDHDIEDSQADEPPKT